MYKQKETTELLVASWEKEDSTIAVDGYKPCASQRSQRGEGGVKFLVC